MAVGQDNIGDVAPRRAGPREPGTKGSVTSGHADVDKGDPVGMADHKASDIEVEGLGPGNASGQMDVHHDRLEDSAQYGLPDFDGWPAYRRTAASDP
jgi:hypothetical protein